MDAICQAHRKSSKSCGQPLTINRIGSCFFQKQKYNQANVDSLLYLPTKNRLYFSVGTMMRTFTLKRLYQSHVKVTT